MKKKFHLGGIAALTLLGSFATSQAQTATTAPVGYNTVTCLANSDTIVSVPFLNTEDSLTSTVSATADDNGNAQLTLDSVTDLTSDQYATLYYVRFTSGTLDGNVYQIASNDASSVSIDLNGDSMGDITNGDSFTIYKFWTLSTLFPQGGQSTIVESTGTRTAQRMTEILLPDNSSVGINLSSASTYYLRDSLGWVQSPSSTDASNVILWPDSFFTIRHTSRVSSATSYTPTGTVDLNSKFVIPLSTTTSGPQDNHIAIPRPVEVSLTDLNLYESGAFVESVGVRTSGRRDQLFVFDNNSSGLNKSASEIYYHNGTNWVRNSDRANADTDTIKPSQGIVIRKYQTNDGATSFWSNTPNY